LPNPDVGYRLAWPIDWLDGQRIAAELDPAKRARVANIAVHWQIDFNQQRVAAPRRKRRRRPARLLRRNPDGRPRPARPRLALAARWKFILFLLKRFDHGMGALTGLSLAAGTAVIAALNDCGVTGAGLKWPNDVLAGGRKLAGVLIELGGEFLGPCHAVIGVGINLRLPADVVAAIDQPATDIATLTGADPPSRNRLAGRLLARLMETLDRFAEHGFGAIAPDYARADLLRDKGRERLGGRRSARRHRRRRRCTRCAARAPWRHDNPLRQRRSHGARAMKLLIDLGNTRLKCALWDGSTLRFVGALPHVGD
jgi:BirA family biotin operon repressor/biotin-[acetyl-CoA-carboxylase] ligase